MAGELVTDPKRLILQNAVKFLLKNRKLPYRKNKWPCLKKRRTRYRTK